MVNVSRSRTEKTKKNQRKMKPTRRNPLRNVPPRELRPRAPGQTENKQKRVPIVKRKKVVKKVAVEATFEVSDEVAGQILDMKKRSPEDSIRLGKFLVSIAKKENASRDRRNRIVEWVVPKKQNKTRKEDPIGLLNEAQIRKDMVQTQIDREKIRAKLLKKSVKVQSDDLKGLIRAEERYRRKISDDPVLAEIRRSFELSMPEPLLNFLTKVMSISSSKRKDQVEQIVAAKHAEHATKFAYVPPKERVMIMGNLSKDQNNVIPVYSDICRGDVKNVEVPDTLFYTYGEQNLISAEAEAMVSDFRRSTDEIKCSCCSNGEAVVPCWANPDCQCSKVARALSGKEDKIIGPFSSVNPESLHFYKTLDFSCSELCGCKGKCTNNSIITIPKHLYQLEVYQRDAIIGNSIRTLNAIPAGAVVTEFVGELIPGSDFSEEDSDFSYTFIHDTENMTQLLKSRLGNTAEKKGVVQWSKKTWRKHAQLMKSSWILNPKWYGNVSRTYGHSCAPNLMPIRVFQKGFLPTQVRLVFVAMRDIFPGTELSIDYGELYLSGELENNCLCGTLPCPSSGLSPINTDCKKICVMIEHESGLAHFENILKEVDKQKR